MLQATAAGYPLAQLSPRRLRHNRAAAGAPPAWPCPRLGPPPSPVLSAQEAQPHPKPSQRRLPGAPSRRRAPGPPHLVRRHGTRRAHRAEGGGPGAPHASSRARSPERRSRQHAGCPLGWWRPQGRCHGPAARAQRGQREPARATARHRCVPSRAGVAIGAPGPGLGALGLRDPGLFRS